MMSDRYEIFASLGRLNTRIDTIVYSLGKMNDRLTEIDSMIVQISRAVDNLEGSLLKTKVELKSSGIDPRILMEPVLGHMDENGIPYTDARPSLDEGIIDFEEEK
jgi:hypothetical protein